MELDKLAEKIKNDCSHKFKKFESLLHDYNKICNLTSITEKNEVFIKHFLDSIAGEEFFPLNAEVVEIGSGGGFPSVPLKILRDDLSFTLIESTGKKCTFLNEVVEKLELDCVQVLNIRAEDGARDKNLREKFDVACARAVARLNILCEYCMPYVKVGGCFIAYKGDAAEEIKNASHAIEILGGKIDNILSFDLPEGGGRRNIIKILKVKPTPVGYPRGQGRERKKPL